MKILIASDIHGSAYYCRMLLDTLEREKADRLVEGLSLTFGNETIGLLDLVTASYFTDGEEYHYGGNTGKNEPVLKFTTKVSTGRSLLMKRGGNRHVGLFICDDDILQRSETELPELINRKSLQYVFVLTNIGSETGESLVQDHEEATIFACTQGFLLSCPLALQEGNEYTAEFMAQADAIIDHEVKYETVSGYIDWNAYCRFRRGMYSIKNADYESEEKKDFVIETWSLFNLFQTMVFPMNDLENMIRQEQLPIGSPSRRIEELKDMISHFPSLMQATMSEILQLLEDYYLQLDSRSKCLF